MRLRLPGRRPRAFSAIGLLLACGVAVWCCAAQAQEFVDVGDPVYAQGGSANESSGYALPDDSSPPWQSDFNECCSDDRGGSYGDCLGHDADCLCGECAGGERWWFAAEYLLWKTDSTHLPPLVTDSPYGTRPVLDSSSTQVLTASKVAESWRSGYRLEMGIWFDDCNTLSLVGDYFNVGQDDYDYFFPGDSGRSTGRPFLNTVTGFQDEHPITGPRFDPLTPLVPIVYEGTVAVTADDEFQGTGLAIEQCVYSVGQNSGFGPGTQVILIGGYRYYGYNSRLAITDTSSIVSGRGAGAFDTRRDVFTSSNQFQGGELGVRARVSQTACWFDGMFKIALGGHYKKVTINGDTVTVPTGMPAEFSEGGLLTSSETNIGEYSDSRARLIPEFRLGIGVFLTPQWTFRAGCTAIVWSGVVRAADGIPPNLAVDPRNIPPGTGTGGVSPVFTGLGGSELVATGLDLGFEYNY